MNEPDRVLLALQRVGGRAEATQVAGQLGISHSEALQALRSLSGRHLVELREKEWVLTSPIDA